MASIKPYKDKWRAQLYVAGVRDSATFRLKREAETWASVRTAEILSEKNTPIGNKFTFSQALKKYRDEVSPGKRGSRWEEIRIGAMLEMASLPLQLPIGEVATPHLAAWRDDRLKSVTPGTVLREMSLLSAILETARKEWQWIKENPIKDVGKPKRPDHREIVISRREIITMLREMGHAKGPCKSSSQAAARCFILALRTGMRAGEICGLTWDRVETDYCILVETKTKPRNVPLVPKASRLIESMRGWDSRLVFGISSQTLDALFRRYRDRAGLDGFTFHDSRHTAATWLARKLDVLTLCKMFGWKNPAQAMVYYNPTASDIAKLLSGK